MSGEYAKSRSGISIVSKVEEPGNNRNDLCHLRDIGVHQPLGPPVKYQHWNGYADQGYNILFYTFFRILHRMRACVPPIPLLHRLSSYR